MTQKEIKDELLKIRNEFYSSLPIGEMDVWDLLIKINKHIKKVDILIDSIDEED